ncbi:unnamed protein product [Closterium sp. NIES-54]
MAPHPVRLVLSGVRRASTRRAVAKKRSTNSITYASGTSPPSQRHIDVTVYPDVPVTVNRLHISANSPALPSTTPPQQQPSFFRRCSSLLESGTPSSSYSHSEHNHTEYSHGLNTRQAQGHRFPDQPIVRILPYSVGLKSGSGSSSLFRSPTNSPFPFRAALPDASSPVVAYSTSTSLQSRSFGEASDRSDASGPVHDGSNPKPGDLLSADVSSPDSSGSSPEDSVPVTKRGRPRKRVTSSASSDASSSASSNGSSSAISSDTISSDIIRSDTASGVDNADGSSGTNGSSSGGSSSIRRGRKKRAGGKSSNGGGGSGCGGGGGSTAAVSEVTVSADSDTNGISDVTIEGAKLVLEEPVLAGDVSIAGEKQVWQGEDEEDSWEMDAEAEVTVMRAVDEGTAPKPPPLSKSDRERVNNALKHFATRGWAADQALAIYIPSRFFPTAASKFRRFVLRCCRPELASALAHMGAGRDADEFLFPLFAEFCFGEFPEEIRNYRDLVNSADMTKPHVWYPQARAIPRKVVYHMGPTNSGKTHRALVRFKEACSGTYCGPLRLLAMEVFDRVNADGVYCNLVTGQERKEMPFAHHTACTIEMANLSTPVDVAIIDEIQMISDDYRGWAWTRALLGVQAAEVHVCGDPSVLPLLRAICDATGDAFECHHYHRFAPLTVDQTSLQGDLGRVSPGDCIVAFSRREIFEIKRAVEMTTKHRCCVVYGALPPETRRQQARLFNEEESGFRVLVASDAIGMGLNLSIRRVVFSTLHKFNGEEKILIPSPMVKQIAGRAGRRGSRYEEGVVTCLDPTDTPLLIAALQDPVEPTTAAGLFPLFEQVEVFASQLPDVSFARLLDRFVETSKLDGTYFLCRTDNIRRVATMLDKIKGLTLRDRFAFCSAPANARDPTVMAALLRFAHQYAEGRPVPLLAGGSGGEEDGGRDGERSGGWEGGKGGPGMEPAGQWVRGTWRRTAASDLMALETKHQVASLYLWLSYQFPKGAFPDASLATDKAQNAAKQLSTALLEARTPNLSSSFSKPGSVSARYGPGLTDVQQQQLWYVEQQKRRREEERRGERTEGVGEAGGEEEEGGVDDEMRQLIASARLKRSAGRRKVSAGRRKESAGTSQR